MAFSLLILFSSCKPNINSSSSIVSNNSSNMVSSELLNKVSKLIIFAEEHRY